MTEDQDHDRTTDLRPGRGGQDPRRQRPDHQPIPVLVLQRGPVLGASVPETRWSGRAFPVLAADQVRRDLGLASGAPRPRRRWRKTSPPSTTDPIAEGPGGGFPGLPALMCGVYGVGSGVGSGVVSGVTSSTAPGTTARRSASPATTTICRSPVAGSGPVASTWTLAVPRVPVAAADAVPSPLSVRLMMLGSSTVYTIVSPAGAGTTLPTSSVNSTD